MQTEIKIKMEKLKIDPRKIIIPEIRVINEASAYRCLKCNSSASRKGFLGFFGERLCDNNQCENSKKRFIKFLRF